MPSAVRDTRDSTGGRFPKGERGGRQQRGGGYPQVRGETKHRVGCFPKLRD